MVMPGTEGMGEADAKKLLAECIEKFHGLPAEKFVACAMAIDQLIVTAEKCGLGQNDKHALVIVLSVHLMAGTPIAVALMGAAMTAAQRAGKEGADAL